MLEDKRTNIRTYRCYSCDNFEIGRGIGSCNKCGSASVFPYRIKIPNKHINMILNDWIKQSIDYKLVLWLYISTCAVNPLTSVMGEYVKEL
jgi:hypothetical protein